MYFYNSKIGLMQINLDKVTNRFILIINNVCYGTYHSAKATADDVYIHTTSCDEWDMLDGEVYNVPDDINGWVKKLY
ncbi:hypothetical protein OXPF_39670 [Oxobacter pfennigii]|uniref:Uncharacterized protein n=1 Tax=Oxobacter pfennigii TaxID=36849 RepID=A0A0P8W3M6_9CLOT|nr:hypothetical protein OXPF_39670 [Oxobacter pfennigii]